ncbi:unnamed protein product [Phaedon cochleariae]|uniref:ubiquitinyl hydrolase 1 n=1 Tax=Phaedon cochleariae TaxID=80249 RepID=A0A9N9SBL4_PHACE|nr:unnamed protein product [Phaedon cochleariae]
MRCSQTWPRKKELSDLDDILRSCLVSITNTNLDDQAWTQASFPVNKGGLGIRRTEELALPAYLASVHSVAGLVTSIIPEFVVENEASSAIREWCRLTGLPPPSTSVQKLWDSPLVNKAWDRIISSTSVRDKARLQAVSLKESGSWLNAFPIPSLGNFLDDNCLRIPVALRLGAALCCSYECICCTEVDVYGHHGLSCNKSSGRYMRHSAINDVIKRALISGNVQSILEPPGLCRDDGKRPDGMSLIPWKRGKALIWDVTCVDSLADSNIVSSIKAAGTPACEAEKRKCGKYKCLEDKFIFIPLGFETFGPWGPSAKEIISTIGHLIYSRSSEARSTEYLRQRISIEIQRGNAACILNTIPSSKGLEEIFYILGDAFPIRTRTCASRSTQENPCELVKPIHAVDLPPTPSVVESYSSNLSTYSTPSAFAEVIEELWSEDSTDQGVNMNSLKCTIQKFAPCFIGNAEQDAQEFMSSLLLGLHEDINKVIEKSDFEFTDIVEIVDVNEKALESWSRFLKVENSEIVNNFVGLLKSSLKCTYCGYFSVTFDPFWDLSLPIPQRTRQLSLFQCLDSFTREESLDGEDKPTCSKCKERRECTKSLSIQRFPEILVFHLKRFSLDLFVEKLNVTVDFPLKKLDMSYYAADGSVPFHYDLYAISNHSGTINSGHYTAYCKHPYSNIWHEFNDLVSIVVGQNLSEGCSTQIAIRCRLHLNGGYQTTSPEIPAGVCEILPRDTNMMS